MAICEGLLGGGGLLLLEGWSTTDLFQSILHDLWAVVDSKDNVGDTSISKGLDLVLNHWLVCKLDQGLRHSQGLMPLSFVSS